MPFKALRLRISPYNLPLPCHCLFSPSFRDPQRFPGYRNPFNSTLQIIRYCEHQTYSTQLILLFYVLSQQHLHLALHVVILDSFFFRIFQCFAVSLWPVHLTKDFPPKYSENSDRLLSVVATYIKNNEASHDLIQQQFFIIIYYLNNTINVMVIICKLCIDIYFVQ